MSSKNAILTQLDNGLRIVTHFVPILRKTEPAVSISVHIMAGARDEVTGGYPRGAMHYLEHGLNFGSEKHPSPPRQLIEAVDGFNPLNNQFNLAVGPSFTTCYANVPAAAFGYSLDVMGAMLSHPNLPRDNIDSERPIIQIERTSNNLNFASLENILAPYVAYGNHPRLHPVIGDGDGIRAISADTLHDIHAQNVRAGRTVIAVEGPVAHKAVVDAVKSSFALSPGVRPPSEVPVYTGGDVRHPLPLEGLHIAIGFKAPTAEDFKAVAALQVARNLLIARNNKGAHSLFDPLRGRGVIYEVNTIGNQWMDAGLLTIACNTSLEPGEVRKNLTTIRDVLVSLAEHVDGASFDRVRGIEEKICEKLKKSRTFSSNVMAEDVFMHGRVMPPQYYSGLRLDVTPDDVRKIVRDMVIDNPPTFLAVGDVRHVPHEEEIKEIFGRRKPPAAPNLPIAHAASLNLAARADMPAHVF